MESQNQERQDLEKRSNKGSKSIISIALGTFLIGVFGGWLFFGNSENSKTDSAENTEETVQTEWTCSMHPQIRQPKGDCPICGMDLIPAGNGDDTEGDNLEVKMSATAMQLADVRTAMVKMKKPIRKIHLNGKVEADERFTNSQTSHISGRIEKLMVNYQGEAIKKGQVTAYLYSPELVTAQEELLEAYKIREEQPALFKAAQQKLRNWRLPEGQIKEILETKKILSSFPILSDFNGVVLAKMVKEGDYINRGNPLFQIADLSKLWILFEAYEHDLQWIKLGDEIDYSVESLPGEKFKATVSFIDPVINPKTRVAKVRVAVQNNQKKLKPEMFAAGAIHSVLQDKEQMLTVPKSAVLWTGRRSLVYIKTKEDKGVHFKMREVLLGPDLGEAYTVEEGLKEGEEIAIHGAFSIDAAAQLAGKTSMMNPPAGAEKETIEREKASVVLEQMVSDYIRLKEVLSRDNYKLSLSTGEELNQSLKDLSLEWLGDEETLDKIERLSAELVKSSDIEKARIVFIKLSKEMIELTKTVSFSKTVFVQYCPMADQNKGASWLSYTKPIENPYFGQSMLGCGETTLTINSIQ